MVFLALRMSIDALEATEQVAAPDLERLHDTLYALESLTYFQRSLAEVTSATPSPFKWFAALKGGTVLAVSGIQPSLEQQLCVSSAGNRLQLLALQPGGSGRCAV